MNNVDNNVNPPLTARQQTFISETMSTRTKIITEIGCILLNCKEFSAEVFLETQVQPKQKLLSDIDNRTNKFFQWMMNSVIFTAINESPLVKVRLDLREHSLRGQMTSVDFRKNFVGGAALPHVKELIHTLDNIAVSIVDDVVAAFNENLQ